MIRLEPDSRTMTVDLMDGQITLRAPSLAEWRQIRDAYLEGFRRIEADEEYGDVAYGEGVFAAAFALAVELLSSSPKIDPDKLPVDLTGVDPYHTMLAVWCRAVVKIGEIPWHPGQPLDGDDFTPIPGG